MIEAQQELIESYQPHSKGHKLKKRKIIGLGGSKSTGASGLKKVQNFSRSKSAPAGFGVLEEKSEEKSSNKIKIKIKSDIEEKRRRKKQKKKRKSKKQGIYGGHYYDFSFLDGSSSGDSGGDGGGGGE